MGRASSSKKVARAARAGGSSSGNRRNLAFPALIAAIVVVGLLLLVFARTSVFGTAAAEPPLANVDHWHAAYGIYVCDTWLPPLQDEKQDTTGIHTHGDSVIHIHPFLGSAAGRNATFGKWGEVVGVGFGSDSITLPHDEGTLEDGYDCDGTPAQLSVHEWPADALDGPPIVYTSDFGDIPLDANGDLFTIAVVPEGTEVPKPPAEAVLAALDPTTDNTTQPLDELLGGTSGSPDGQQPSTGQEVPLSEEQTRQLEEQFRERLQNDPELQRQLEEQSTEPSTP